MPHRPLTSDPVVTVFWRPGCGFSAGLLRSLERTGLDFERINIWEDPEASALVRSVAKGNETVPTVRVGDVALVNPTAHEVMREVALVAPARVPEGYEPPPPTPFGRLIGRLRGG